MFYLWLLNSDGEIVWYILTQNKNAIFEINYLLYNSMLLAKQLDLVLFDIVIAVNKHIKPSIKTLSYFKKVIYIIQELLA